MKVKTTKDCWHNGAYHGQGETFECNCNDCKNKKVDFFVFVDGENKKNLPENKKK